MGVNTVDIVHHIMDICGKITETDLKKNHNIFDESLYITIPIDKYVEIIDECIHYADGENQPYTAAQIINNTYSTVSTKGLYKESIKM